ncbi:MAG TPA: helix-turn-helix transcriptional regulator [bacterium]|nr:helix-turn-helix transcriptional regulator [bacterium]
MNETFATAPRTTPYPDATRVVVCVAKDYAPGHVIPPAWHPRAQLIYATRGVMTVNAPQGTWVLPPQRAVWVPAGTPHFTRMAGAASMRTLYIDPAAVPGLPPGCCVVTVSPLLRELIAEAMHLPAEYDEAGPAGRLVAVLLDQFRALPVAPLHLPLPADERLQRIAAALRAEPGDNRTLAAWGRLVGASPRTLARGFLRETGLTFRAWRQQVRLLEALERLAAGEAVTAVALELGYETPSAFVAMFRRALGTSPGRYFAASGGGVRPERAKGG